MGAGPARTARADGVDDLDAALAGAGHTFADELDYLPRVRKSDCPCRGDHLEGAGLDAAVAALRGPD